MGKSSGFLSGSAPARLRNGIWGGGRIAAWLLVRFCARGRESFFGAAGRSDAVCVRIGKPPDFDNKFRRFLYRGLPYRTRSERPMRSTVVDLMPFRRQRFVTVVP